MSPRSISDEPQKHEPQNIHLLSELIYPKKMMKPKVSGVHSMRKMAWALGLREVSDLWSE